MQEYGPASSAFRSRFQQVNSTLLTMGTHALIDEMRALNEDAAAVLGAPRNSRILDKEKHRIQNGRRINDRDLAEFANISAPAMSNFRKSRESSFKVRTFLESLFHRSYEVPVHPKHLWWYTQMLTIVKLLVDQGEPPAFSYASFVQSCCLLRAYSDWLQLQNSGDTRGLKQLSARARAAAIAELDSLSRSGLNGIYFGDLDKPPKDFTDSFIQCGPYAMALDLRVLCVREQGGVDEH